MVDGAQRVMVDGQTTFLAIPIPLLLLLLLAAALAHTSVLLD